MDDDANPPTRSTENKTDASDSRRSDDQTRAADVGDPQRRRFPLTIGRHRIIRVLGEGGMGTVYEAEEEHPRRRVALKVIKPGCANAEMLRRFEQESQALGRLHHPGIAQIYVAATADNGFGPQPYFAMEFIKGRSLLTHADEKQLNTRQRLELIAEVCDAVHHAHQRGIIHRDLKPSNILVDEDGRPKILDFGVARVTDNEVQATRQTYLGEIVGTLAYMSPEQLMADPLEIDTRSDIYALGVILYELLAGRRPYKTGLTLHGVIQAIHDEEPARLGTISRTYRGDIETIVAKTLEKDKARRYVSAADLSADIRRYLKDEPIVARPASTSYQLQKFARRHKTLVIGIAAVFVVLVAGVVASTWQAARARRAEQSALAERDRAAAAQQTAASERDRALIAERIATDERNRAVAAEEQAVQERNRAVTEKHRADTESATATAVNDFLQNDLLSQAGASAQAQPDAKPDPDLKVRTALDRAAAGIEGKFGAQTLVEASIRLTIGKTYEDLGLYSEAERHIGRGLDLRRRALGDNHASVLTTMSDMAGLYAKEAKYEQAERLFTTSLEVGRRVMGERHPKTLATMTGLGRLYMLQGKLAQAEPLYIQALDAQRRVLGEQHSATLDSMDALASLYWRQGKYAQAEPVRAKVVDLQRRVLGNEHPATLSSINNLALLSSYQGKYAQAEALFTNVIETMRRVLGEHHLETMISIGNLGIVYFRQGRYADAETLFTKVLDLKQRVLGDEHPETLTSMNNLAVLYRAEGKYQQAETLYMKVLEVQRRVLGDQHPNMLLSMNGLAFLYVLQDRNAQAEALYKKVLESQRRVLGEEHPDTVNTMHNLAVLYAKEGKNAEAEPLSSRTVDIRRRVLGEHHPDTIRGMNNLGLIYLNAGKNVQAESLLRTALTSYEKTAPDSWERYNCQSLLGASLAAQKRYAEAEPLVVSGYEGLKQREAAIPKDSLIAVARAGRWIVDLYQDWGIAEKAAEWRQRLQINKGPSGSSGTYRDRFAPRLARSRRIPCAARFSSSRSWAGRG